MNLPQISARKRARGEYMFTEDGLFRDATVRTVPSMMTSTSPSAPMRGEHCLEALSQSGQASGAVWWAGMCAQPILNISEG